MNYISSKNYFYGDKQIMKTLTKTIIKEKPITFCAEMIRANLEDNKNTTRRVLKAYNIQNDENAQFSNLEKLNERRDDFTPKSLHYGPGTFAHFKIKNSETIYTPVKSKFEVNDILYVRESVYISKENFTDKYTQTHDNGVICGYRASMSLEAQDTAKQYGFKCTTPMFMPKKYARIFLKVTNIRIERLQDISEVDVLKEGILKATKDNRLWKYGLESWAWSDWVKDPKEAYAKLWDSLSGKSFGYSWKENPFVWVIDFEVLKDYKLSEPEKVA